MAIEIDKYNISKSISDMTLPITERLSLIAKEEQREKDTRGRLSNILSSTKTTSTTTTTTTTLGWLVHRYTNQPTIFTPTYPLTVVEEMDEFLDNLDLMRLHISTVRRIITEKQAIKAAILIYLQKNHLVYLNQVRRMFPSMPNSKIVYHLKSLSKSKIIQRATETNLKTYKTTRKSVETILKSSEGVGAYQIEKIIWYVLTEKGNFLTTYSAQELSKILPKQPRGYINKWRSMYMQTHKQQEDVELSKLKAQNKEYNAIVQQIIHYTRFDFLKVSKMIQKDVQATGLSRKEITEKWLQELEVEFRMKMRL